MISEANTAGDSWLLLALPGVLLAGLFLASGVSRSRSTTRLLGIGLAVASWLIATHAGGRLTGSFHRGLWWGTLAVAPVGILEIARRFRLSRHGRSAGKEPSRRGGVLMVVSALLATAVIAPLSLGWAFHDELHITGHLSIAAEMLRDVYPPRHLTFPQFELRYHYAFNLLVAAVAAIGRLPVPTALDLTTLACWAYTWCLLWAVGERVAGAGGGLPTAILTLFGGGIPWLAAGGDESTTFRLLGLVNVNGSTLNPPMVSYFFQHPWTLGLPLGLAGILIHLEEPPVGGRRAIAKRLTALAILLVALAFSQFVLFLCLMAALAVAEPLAFGRRSVARSDEEVPAIEGLPAQVSPPGASETRASLRSRVAYATVVWLVILGVAGLASRLGGFFLPGPDRGSDAIVLFPWVAGTPWGSLVWLAATYGLLLPLGLSGLLAARRGRLLLALLAGGGLLVINLARYRYSWDILKFATVAALGLSIATAAAWLRVARLRPRPLGIVMAGLLGAGATASGFGFVAAFTLRLEGIPRDIYPEHPALLAPEDAEAIRWLRPRVAPDEVVFRSLDASPAYAQHGGLPQAWFDQVVATFGFSRGRLSARARLLSSFPDDPDLYLNQRISWFVLGPEDDRLNPLVDRWIALGRAGEVARFGPLRVVRLGPRTSGAGGS